MKHPFQKIVVTLLLLASTAALSAQKILVVNTYNPTYPWTAYFNLGLRQLAEQSGGSIDLFFEDLDITRFGDEVHLENFARYLSAKYADYPIDAVIGNSDQACTFIETYCKFPQSIPKGYYTSNLAYDAENILCLDVMYSEVISKTWRLINDLQPKLTSIFIIAGDPSLTETVYTEFSKIVPRNISVALFTNFTFEELRNTMSSLPKTTAVFFIPVTQDRSGTQIIPKQLLSEICTISNAPIYTVWETLIGTGCVGGEMLSAQKTAQELVKGLQSYLKNEKFNAVYSISQPVIDWSAAQTYNVEKNAIPQEARIVNKPDPFYITHIKAILFIVNIILAFFFIFLLIGIILIVRAYRKLRIINTELASEREKAEVLSLHDTLTGLFNRRAIQPMIVYEMNRKKRFGSPVSLLILDIDHFKKVNDTYGHDVGDIVLKKIAQTLHDYRRSTDLPSRWGGEEFLILLADTDESQAILIADKMRTACSSLVFDECESITVSIGVAEVQHDENFDSWFRRADAALYTAKNSGRNKIIASSGMDTETAQKQTGHELLLLHLSWKDDYRLGIDTYDQQHKNLFTISNKLISAVVNNESKEIILAVLDQLQTDTASHFKDEQNYLEKRNCAFIERHIKEHNYLLDQLRKKAAAFEAKNISAYDFISFICNDLITKHILGEDKLSFENIRR